HESRDIYPTLNKWWISRLTQFTITGIDHLVENIFQQFSPIVFDRTYFFLWVLDHDLTNGIGHFWICYLNELVFIQQVHLVFRTWFDGFRNLHVREQSFHFGFHLLRIYITDNNQGLQIWTVPFSMEITDYFRIKVHDHLFRSNRKTIGIARAIQHYFDVLITHTLHSTASTTHLFHNYPTFLIDLIGLQQSVLRPITHYLQAIFQ